MGEAKKYYWLKLKKDFFKRHDIQIIESMDNGKEYVLFYLKLLAESVSHNGELRFSETIPYNDKMLATITNTNIDIVRMAVKVLQELGLLNLLDDDTIYMEEVNKMLGAETEWAEKKRAYRLGKELKSGQCPQNVLPMSDKSKILDTEKDIDKDIDKESKNLSLFAEFWELYPRKVNKKKAQDKYYKLMKDKVEHSAIMDGLKTYLKYIRQNDVKAEYIKHPTTWLNGECWNDELEIKTADPLPAYLRNESKGRTSKPMY